MMEVSAAAEAEVEAVVLDAEAKYGKEVHELFSVLFRHAPRGDPLQLAARLPPLWLDRHPVLCSAVSAAWCAYLAGGPFVEYARVCWPYLVNACVRRCRHGVVPHD